MKQPSKDMRITRRNMLIYAAAFAVVAVTTKGERESPIAPGSEASDAELTGGESAVTKDFVLYL